VSGYHHDMLGNWGTLRVALFSAGDGATTLRSFSDRGQ
jgi:hypothetical protein